MYVADILFYLLIVTIGVQFIFYGIIFLKFILAKDYDQPFKNIPISIIVCAKNEEENLSKLIPELLLQEYPEFEIVLINDGSTDKTLEIMESFRTLKSNIKIVNVKSNEAFWGNKKYALTLGIKASSYDFLLFTDADCIPNSNQWIKIMASHFSNKTSIIIGYGSYKKQAGSLLNKLIRFETLLTAIQYFSYAKIKIPYMAVGRNLAYRKELFYGVNGFISHLKVKSGDDDLFINEVATHVNTDICFSKKSFTTSEPKKTLKAWFDQKRRHISTVKYYKFHHKIMLSIFYTSQLCFWLVALSLLLISYKLTIVISLVTFRFLLLFVIIGYSAKKLNELDTILFLPFLELLLIIFQFSIFISNLISKPKYWK